jgi:hypothetical protein
MPSLKECIRIEKLAAVELYSCVAPSLAPSTSLNLLQFSKIFTFRTTFSRNWSGHYASIVGELAKHVPNGKIGVAIKAIEQNTGLIRVALYLVGIVFINRFKILITRILNLAIFSGS